MAKALGEGVAAKKVEDRLSRKLSLEGMVCKMASMRHGKWSRVIDERKSPQLELSLDWG